jgi:hypothetical protein
VLAKFPQHTLTQKIGIEFARFCKLDNSFGDSFVDEIALVVKLKSCASYFECDAHDPLGLGIEFGTVQKLGDGHDLSHRARKDCSGLSQCQADEPSSGRDARGRSAAWRTYLPANKSATFAAVSGSTVRQSASPRKASEISRMPSLSPAAAIVTLRPSPQVTVQAVVAGIACHDPNSLVIRRAILRIRA